MHNILVGKNIHRATLHIQTGWSIFNSIVSGVRRNEGNLLQILRLNKSHNLAASTSTLRLRTTEIRRLKLFNKPSLTD